MGTYKSLKIKYDQHISIMGIGLSVNAPANALINLNESLLKESCSKPSVTIKAFREKVIAPSAEDIKKAQSEYNKYKDLLKISRDIKERPKSVDELRDRRREFAKKIDKAYEMIFDKAPRFTVGVMDVLKKIKDTKDLDSGDYKFLIEELEIIDAKKLKSDTLKEYLERMKNLIDEFIKDNVGLVKRIRNDLKYIIKQKSKELEFDESVSFSLPTIKQGPRVDEQGKIEH